MALCMHTIYMEEDHKYKAQQQHCVKTVMKEVVKKEVIKWIDVEIIYIYQVSESGIMCS